MGNEQRADVTGKRSWGHAGLSPEGPPAARLGCTRQANGQYFDSNDNYFDTAAFTHLPTARPGDRAICRNRGQRGRPDPLLFSRQSTVLPPKEDRFSRNEALRQPSIAVTGHRRRIAAWP